MDPITQLVTAAQKALSFLPSIYYHYFPKKFGYRAAPRNILEMIQPYTFQGKVVELLGQPNMKYSNVAAYRFRNALLQINYRDEYIESLSLAALSTNWPNRFTVFPLSYVLGKHKFSDVDWSEANHLSGMHKEMSSKFYALYRQEYFGFPGRYLYFNFGVISAATFPQLEPAKKLPDGVHEEDPVSMSMVSSLKFNIVSMSIQDLEYVPFSWSNFT